MNACPLSLSPGCTCDYVAVINEIDALTHTIENLGEMQTQQRRALDSMYTEIGAMRHQIGALTTMIEGLQVSVQGLQASAEAFREETREFNSYWWVPSPQAPHQ